MSEILTTGPMRIPGKMTGDPAGNPPNTVTVSIKNPTTKTFRVQLFADVCNVATEVETTFPDTVQTLGPNSCRFRTFTFTGLASPGDILRFFAKGNLDEDAEKLELSFVGVRSSDNMQEPTMFFRHADLLEVEDKDIHQDPVSSSGNAWS
jgi:hypothetical protein